MEQVHITLAFLGNINEKDVKKIEGSLSKIDVGSFEIGIHGVGGIFSAGRVVIFAHAEDKSGWLSKLHAEVIEGLEVSRINVRIEDREFLKHTTFARCKTNSSRVTQYIEANSNLDFGSFVCDTIMLKKSTLTKDGPIYENIYAKKLV